MEIHLKIRSEAGMTKSKMRKMKKKRTKRIGIIIVQRINIKTLPRVGRVGRDCQKMVICRRLVEISPVTSDKTVWNREYTFFSNH